MTSDFLKAIAGRWEGRVSEGKRADASVQLDVDDMMLDYLLYSALQALLSDPGHDEQSSGPCPTNVRLLPLNMVDAFLPIYKANHPDPCTCENAQFRLLLLKFCSVFTRRGDPGPLRPPLSSLSLLRDRHGRRAMNWLENDTPSSSFGIPSLADPVLAPFEGPAGSPARLAQDRERTLAAPTRPSQPRALFGESRSVSLLDSLPLFMSVSACASHVMGDGMSITRPWMDLAVEYMVQATIEQYLVYGAQGGQALREAFAWGYNAHLVCDAGSEDAKVNSMFWGKDGDVVTAWKELRTRQLKAVCFPFLSSLLLPVLSEWNADVEKIIPPAHTDLRTHLANKAQEKPMGEFEARTVGFLCDVVENLPLPVLVQLERGQLEGWTREETTMLLESCGVRS
ncbi:MAG: hypothetical protein M1838_001500 [Thelocarpon superellum]|nr:MAG: hypothetical protein M1838_001500 [Thelocarpon superellum]